jgi:RHS repeat-associated protein
MMSLLDNKVSGSSLSKYAFTYDGNGNITELTDNAASTVATYRYTAFGDVWSSAGSAASENQYRFSTKPLDEEVLRSSSGAFNAGLYYYGFRYYDPQTGRWPSRDPIEERGGLNLYVFVLNNPINSWDLLGLTDDECQKYYIGTCERSLAGRYINMPTKVGEVKIPQSIRARVERLINEDLGHHDVGFLIVEEDDNQEVDLVIGFFADDFKEAGIGALKELAFHLVPWETSWDNAGWVPGTIKRSSNHGPCSADQEVTKEEYERRKSDAESMIGG